MAEQDRTTSEDSGAPAKEPAPAPARKAAVEEATCGKEATPPRRLPLRRRPHLRRRPRLRRRRTREGRTAKRRLQPTANSGHEAPGEGARFGPCDSSAHQRSQACGRQADRPGGSRKRRRRCRLGDGRGARRERPHRDLPTPVVRVRLRHVATGVQRPVDALADNRADRTGVQPRLGPAGRPVRPGQQGRPSPAPEGHGGSLGHPEPAAGDRPGLRPQLPHATLPRRRPRQLGPGADRGQTTVDGRLRPRPAAVAGHAARGPSGRACRADRQAAPRDRRWSGRHDARSHCDRPGARWAGPGTDAPGADCGTAGRCGIPWDGRRGRLVLPREVGEGGHRLRTADRAGGRCATPWVRSRTSWGC